MRNYELDYLVSPLLSEEEAKDLSQKVVDLIGTKNGLVGKNKSFGKIDLAYPIEKRKTAYFEGLSFTLDPENLAEFEKGLKQNKEILRYLLLVKEPLKKFHMPPSFNRPPARENIETSKAELEEIEKKLKEILQ